jgi:hypothetical protein
MIALCLRVKTARAECSANRNLCRLLAHLRRADRPSERPLLKAFEKSDCSGATTAFDPKATSDWADVQLADRYEVATMIECYRC